MNVDTEELKSRINLLSLAEQHATLRRVASTGGGEWCGPCPMPGCNRKRDGFRVQPNQPGGGRWMCRGCTDGKWQDAIAYVMKREGVDFRKACELLGGTIPRPSSLHKAPDFTPPKRNVSAPNQDWQAAAFKFLNQSEHLLWSSAGRKALDGIRARGLTDETIKYYRLGCNLRYEMVNPQSWGLASTEGKQYPLKLFSGWVIPAIIGDEIWYLKIRQVSGETKYLHIRGGVQALFGANSLRGKDIALLTEGEFDSMVAFQSVGDLVGVATLGSAYNPLDIPIWEKTLMHIRTILVCYDSDKTGIDAAKRLKNLSAQIHLVRVPRLRPNDKDINDYFLAGGDLRAWLMHHIENLRLKIVTAPPSDSTLVNQPELEKPQVVNLNSSLDGSWRIDLQKPCYGCGEMAWRERPADVGGGHYCSTCHP